MAETLLPHGYRLLALDTYRRGVIPIAQQMLDHPDQCSPRQRAWATEVMRVGEQITRAVTRRAPLSEIESLLDRVTDVPGAPKDHPHARNEGESS